VLVAAGCGGSSEEGGVPTLGFMTSRDASGFTEDIIKKCAAESGGKYKIEQLPIGPSTDASREQASRRLAAGDTSIDFINLDVIWTAEFSDAGWLVDLTDRVAPMKDLFVPVALDSAFYKDKYWAVPSGTNAAFLYYRTDLVKTPPKTWEALVEAAKQVRKTHPDMTGFVFQGASYEGGTVNALEYLGGAGAHVLSEDGKTAQLDKGDGTVHAMEFVERLVKDDVTSKTTTTFMEEDARLAFQKGDAVFMRNWPYAWALMNKDESSKVKGKFGVAPLPAFEGRESAAVLGGQNYGISASSTHKDLAWDAIMCVTSFEAQKQKTVQRGEMPTLKAVYEDPELRKDVPFIDTVEAGLAAGQNRPITPYYNEVTLSIYKAYNEVLNERISPEEAAKRMQHEIQAAISGKAEI